MNKSTLLKIAAFGTAAAAAAFAVVKTTGKKETGSTSESPAFTEKKEDNKPATEVKPESVITPETEPAAETQVADDESYSDLSLGGLPYLAGKMQDETPKSTGEPIVHNLPPIDMTIKAEEAEQTGDDALPPIMASEVSESEKEVIGDSLPSFDEPKKEEYKPAEIENPVEDKLCVDKVADDKNLQIKTIGNNTVSKDPSDELISMVSSQFNIAKDKLVSISSGNTGLVFEFMYPNMKNEATLVNVYSRTPDGSIYLPKKNENDSVMAFGRSFITDNAELKEFISI